MANGSLPLVEDDAPGRIAPLALHPRRLRGPSHGGRRRGLAAAEENAPDIVVLDWMIEGVPESRCAPASATANHRQRPDHHVTARARRAIGSGAWKPRRRLCDEAVQPDELMAGSPPCFAASAGSGRGAAVHSDLEMDWPAHRVPVAALRSRSAPPSSGCCGISGASRPGLLARAPAERGRNHGAEIETRTVDVHIRRLARR